MKRSLGLALAFGLFLLTGSVSADAPIIGGDGPDRIESRRRKFFAEPSSDGKSLVVFRRTKPHAVPVWQRPGWVDNGYLSDDGEYLVTGWSGANLLDLDYSPALTMLSFHRRDQLVASVSLGELIKDMKTLRHTISHYEWGFYDGFVSAHTFSVSTVEGRTLIFDVTTGHLAREEQSADFRRRAKAEAQPREGAKGRVRSDQQKQSDSGSTR